jgi:hypothetical protein
LSSGKFFIYSSIGGLILGIAILDRYTKLNQNTDTQFKVTKQHRTLSVDFVRQNGLTFMSLPRLGSKIGCCFCALYDNSPNRHSGVGRGSLGSPFPGIHGLDF